MKKLLVLLVLMFAVFLVACEPSPPATTTEGDYTVEEMLVQDVNDNSYILKQSSLFGNTLYVVESEMVLEVGDTVYVKLYEDETVVIISVKSVEITTEEETTTTTEVTTNAET